MPVAPASPRGAESARALLYTAQALSEGGGIGGGGSGVGDGDASGALLYDLLFDSGARRSASPDAFDEETTRGGAPARRSASAAADALLQSAAECGGGGGDGGGGAKRLALALSHQPRSSDVILQNRYFDLEVCIVDELGGVVPQDRLVPLQVYLLYADLSWVDDQSILQIDHKSSCCIERDGVARFRARLSKISRDVDGRSFVVAMSVPEDILALDMTCTRPLCVVSRKPRGRARAAAAAAAASAAGGAATLTAGASASASSPSLSVVPLKRALSSSADDATRRVAPAIDTQRLVDWAAVFESFSAIERRLSLSRLASALSKDDARHLFGEFLGRSL